MFPVNEVALMMYSNFGGHVHFDPKDTKYSQKRPNIYSNMWALYGPYLKE